MGKGQHGFCKGKKSCSAEVLEFFEGVSNHINKGSSVAAASLDFQKTRPLTKGDPKTYVLRDLGGYVVRGEVLSWVKYWLKKKKTPAIIFTVV